MSCRTVVDTVRDPNIMSATASFQRVGLANAAGVLDLKSRGISFVSIEDVF
jgi:hypothetical protein